MVIHRPGVALEALSVLHRLHFALDRLVLDLAVRLAQPVAVGVDALLASLAVLPHLVSLRHPGQAQAVGQNLGDKGLMRQTIWSVMQLIQMLVIWLATQNGVREELCFFQPKLSSALSASQVGKAVRNFMCERDAPLESLRNYRTVKGTGVRLRVDPSMKAAEVQVTLEDRALLEVLDGSNRDWLHVSVIGEEGLEGWISRKYTHRLLQ